MAVQIRSVLKNWFRTNLKPTQQQFWDWIDSYWHKGDTIPTASVDGLDATLNSLPTPEELQAVQDLQPKVVTSNGTGTYQVSAGKLVMCIVLTVTENNTIKIGLSPGGNEIDENEVRTNEAYTINYNNYFIADTTIYFTGDCTAQIYLR